MQWNQYGMQPRQSENGKTYIRPLLLVRALEQLGQHLDARHGLQRDAGQQAAVVDVPDEVLGVGLGVRLALGRLGRAREGRLVVEAVEVAAGLLEFLDPFFRLRENFPFVSALLLFCVQSISHLLMHRPLGERYVPASMAMHEVLGSFVRCIGRICIHVWQRMRMGIVPYLGDHHMAIERPASVVLGRPVDVSPDLGDDGGAECDVGHEVAVPFPSRVSAQLGSAPLIIHSWGSNGLLSLAVRGVHLAYMIST